VSDFHIEYADALDAYLTTRDEASLAVGLELGRRAIGEQMSVLEIVEHHHHLVHHRQPPTDKSAALQFLLQTLATVDVATRGFVEGTQRYEQERARAEGLADRDEFRTALVNSLQEGFFVADHTGTIVEINDAFAEITGYGTDQLPCPPPYPWIVDTTASRNRLSALTRDGSVEFETEIKHRAGGSRWIAVAINAVTGGGSEQQAYVGTIRDITAAHTAAIRERAVARLATAVSVARSVDEVLSIMLTQIRSTLDVERLTAVIWPPDEGPPAIHVAGAPAVANWFELDADWRRTFEDARDWLPLTVTPVGAAPSAGTTRGFVAMLSGARDVVVSIEHARPRQVSEADRQLVIALVGHLSLALQHVRQFEIARETSLTLQRSMLPPSDLPAGFAVRYEPAVPPLEIGGDFYDVLPLADNCIGISIGDCVGRGLPAAAVMGQLRASARALLLTGAAPAKVLEQLDAVAEFIPDAFCSTVFVAVLDIASQTVVYSSAGHMPPVLAAGTGPPEVLTDGASVPLAVHRDEPRPQASRPLAPGSTLLLYTDGLVERRDEGIDDQIGRVAAVLTGTTGLSVDGVADTVLRAMAPPAGYDDDVAVVVYRGGTPLVLDYEATAYRLGDVRHRLGEWLTANAVSETMAADIVLVVNEACTNCVEHAYRDQPPGRMRVAAEIQPGSDGRELRISVTDFGSWKRPPADPGTRGKGLLLINTVGDRVDVEGTSVGTTVGVTFHLPHDRADASARGAANDEGAVS
jgi:PAS domain S-box-containing protein